MNRNTFSPTGTIQNEHLSLSLNSYQVCQRERSLDVLGAWFQRMNTIGRNERLPHQDPVLPGRSPLLLRHCVYLGICSSQRKNNQLWCNGDRRRNQSAKLIAQKLTALTE